MRGPTLSSGWRLVVCLVGLVACVEPPSGPGEFGEVRVRPSYAAGEEPATIGVTIDSAAVVVARSSTGERLVDTTTAYTGRALAWVVDLHADPESVSISVELRGDAQGDARRAVADARDSDDGPVLGPAVELLERPARARHLGYSHLDQDLVGPQRGLEEAGEERVDRNVTVALRPPHHHGGPEREQHRRQVRRRVAVGE